MATQKIVQVGEGKDLYFEHYNPDNGTPGERFVLRNSKDNAIAGIFTKGMEIVLQGSNEKGTTLELKNADDFKPITIIDTTESHKVELSKDTPKNIATVEQKDPDITAIAPVEAAKEAQGLTLDMTKSPDNALVTYKPEGSKITVFVNNQPKGQLDQGGELTITGNANIATTEADLAGARVDAQEGNKVFLESTLQVHDGKQSLHIGDKGNQLVVTAEGKGKISFKHQSQELYTLDASKPAIDNANAFVEHVSRVGEAIVSTVNAPDTITTLSRKRGEPAQHTTNAKRVQSWHNLGMKSNLPRTGHAAIVKAPQVHGSVPHGKGAAHLENAHAPDAPASEAVHHNGTQAEAARDAIVARLDGLRWIVNHNGDYEGVSGQNNARNNPNRPHYPDNSKDNYFQQAIAAAKAMVNPDGSINPKGVKAFKDGMAAFSKIALDKSSHLAPGNRPNSSALVLLSASLDSVAENGSAALNEKTAGPAFDKLKTELNNILNDAKGQSKALEVIKQNDDVIEHRSQSNGVKLDAEVHGMVASIAAGIKEIFATLINPAGSAPAANIAAIPIVNKGREA